MTIGNVKFARPPLNFSLTLPEIYDWHYEHNPNYPAFSFTNDQGNVENIHYYQIVPAIHRAGKYVANALDVDLGADPKANPVVAIIGTADTVTTMTTMLGMVRLGVTFFPISPRFSARVVAHLLSITGISHIFVSTEVWISELAHDAINLLQQSDTDQSLLKISSLPKFEDIYVQGSKFERLPAKKIDRLFTTLLVHTSSSTSEYPKAIPWSTQFCVQQALIPVKGSYNLTGHVFGCQSIELFHGIGMLFLLWMPSCGLVIGTFRPSSPATKATPDAVFESYQHLKPTYILAPTRYIEHWATEPLKVQYLCTLTGVLSGGKMIREIVGDFLASEGVCLRNMYGSTESGHLSAVPSAPQGADWAYFELNPQCNIVFDPIGDGTYHAVVMPSPTHRPPIINTKFGGQDAYATGDLFLPHPSKLGHWRYLGRRDAQIMLSSGEVVNPTSIEEKLCGHPAIISAVVFGNARGRLGVIFDVKHEYSSHGKDQTALARFRNEIWPTVETVNASSPKYAQISKQMLIIACSNKPFTYNQKGSPRRPMVLIQYQPEIDALYSSPESDILFTREVVGNVSSTAEAMSVAA